MMTYKNIQINDLVRLSVEAGHEIMKIYQKDFSVELKNDESPLTEADKASNEVIVKGLISLYPQIPIISEENKLTDYSERKSWEWCWLVDPLDGTKEFIKKNGEFTVNIALVHQNKIVVGVIFVPAQNKIYYAASGLGAYMMDNSADPVRLKIRDLDIQTLKVVGSRSHQSQEVEDFVDKLKGKYRDVEFVPAGSSLKFCLVAEGKADIYPRLAPTMEWDTAAGQIIAEEAGAEVIKYPENVPLEYNKENLLNPYFIVFHPQIDVK